MPFSRRSRSSRAKGSREERLGGHIQNKYDEKWNARFKELLEYRSEQGDCDVPAKQGKLGRWVGLQRTAYKDDKLAQDRIDRLNNIGFEWAPRKSEWETRFDELVQYKGNHGGCNVPQSQGQLGTWVSYQRHQYKKGKLLQYRINRLNSIGFDWTPQRVGSRKRKSLSSIKQNRSSSRKKRASLSSATVESLSVGTGAETMGEGRNMASVSLSNPSRSHLNIGSESEDEVDEIGALIYDQVVQQRQAMVENLPELCVSNAAGYDCETDSEIDT